MRKILWLLAVLLIVPTVVAQESAPVDSRVSDLLNQMQAGDLQTRERAFRNLIALISEGSEQRGAANRAQSFSTDIAKHSEQSDRIRLGLIQLLSLENDTFARGKHSTNELHSEDDGEYYAELVDAVARLNDERAIPALIGSMTTGGIAQGALQKFGPKALQLVLDKMNDPDALIRATALRVGIGILEQNDEPASHARSQELLFSAFRDADYVVRRSAIRDVECLKGNEVFVPVLERLSTSDPVKLPGRALDGGDGGDFYPVRYSARHALNAIRNHESCRVPHPTPPPLAG